MKIKSVSLPLFLAVSAVLVSCAPVLDREYLKEGERRVSFAALRENPGQFRGRLFIMGGVIVHSRLTESGFELEALHAPVDGHGYFSDRDRSEGRFIAIAPKGGQLPDPLVYQEGRRVTLAAVFVEVQKGRIDEMEYPYPVFHIKQIHLWQLERPYDSPIYYHDLWYDPFPYYYRHPWCCEPRRQGQ